MEHLDQKKKITIMIAIMSAMLFATLNQTIVSTALPRIIAELGGEDYLSWVFTVYMLAATVTAVLVGKLSDIYGRKPFILIGLIVFIIGSFLAGLSNTIYELIVYRGIQGLGGGIIMSTAFTAVGDLFAPRERGRWQGLMSAVFGLASVFGPTLGGYIVDHADWHWVFWVFLPVGFAALVLIWILFPAKERSEGESVDYLGSLFITATIIPLLLAFSWVTTYGWSSFRIIGLFAASAISLAIFIVVELKAKSPALPLGLFKNSVFTVSNIVGFLMGAGMFGSIMYMPFFVQGVIGTSAKISGYVMMPMTLSLVVASAIAGQIITKTGKYKVLALLGLFIMGSGMILLSTMGVETTNLIAVLYMIAVGTGLGIGFPIFTLTVQNAVEDKLLGVATASSQLFRQLGGTIGVSIMGSIMSSRMSKKMAELASGAPEIDPAELLPEAAEKLSELNNPSALMDPEKLLEIQNALPSELQGVFTQIITLLRESLGYALSGTFLVGAVVIFIAFLFTFLLKEIPLRTAMDKGKKDLS
jgi:EmrB/QacA subfamily drug resistance transporter